MSLTEITGYYNFYDLSIKIANYLRSQSIDLYSMNDVIQNDTFQNEYFKLYINFRNKKIVKHKPICSHDQKLISGFSHATKHGVWIGVFKNMEDIDSFLSNLKNLLLEDYSIESYETCNHCQ